MGYNQVATIEDTITHPLVQQVIAGAKRRLAHKIVKKEPIMPEILGKLVEKLDQAKAPLSDIRTLTMCLVRYADFWKLSEADVKFYTERLKVSRSLGLSD